MLLARLLLRPLHFERSPWAGLALSKLLLREVLILQKQ